MSETGDFLLACLLTGAGVVGHCLWCPVKGVVDSAWLQNSGGQTARVVNVTDDGWDCAV